MTYLQNAKEESDLFKEKGLKARNLLMKVFARSNGDQQASSRMGHPVDDPKIRATKNTKTFRKSLETKNSEGTSKVHEENLEAVSEPIPIPGNETILEGKVQFRNRQNNVQLCIFRFILVKLAHIFCDKILNFFNLNTH